MPLLFKGSIHDISAPVAVVVAGGCEGDCHSDYLPKVLKSRDVLLSVEKETLPALVHTLYIISEYTVCVCAVDPQCVFCAILYNNYSIPLTNITRHSKKGGTEADLQY